MTTATVTVAVDGTSKTVDVTLAPPLLFNGDLSAGDLSQWQYVQGAQDAISVVTSPARAGHRYAIQNTVEDSDTSAVWTGHYVNPSNPAATVISPGLFKPGDDVWIGWSSMFPSGMPIVAYGTPQFLQFMECYGPPYNGSPPIGLDIAQLAPGQGNSLMLARDHTHNYDHPWHVPLTYDAWHDFVLHVVFSTDPTVGLVEIWLDGVRQTFSQSVGGGQTLRYATLVSGLNWDGSHPNVLYLANYRLKGMYLPGLTIYHAAAKVGKSYAAVAP